MGKTRAVSAILCRYPQVIVHTEYKGHAFFWKQLTWLHLDCPPNGSLAELCARFFEDADAVLGTNYAQTYLKPRSLQFLALGMAKVAAIQGLGILVIDQLSNLATASRPNRDLMLKFLAAINSTLRVPTLLIGTEDTIGVLRQNSQVARQCISQPLPVLDKLTEADFARVAKAYWRHEYLEESLTLTNELLSGFYNLTWGNPALFCALYQLANLRAISLGVTRLSVDLILSVYTDCFAALHPHLESLRQGHTSAAVQFNIAMASKAPVTMKVATTVRDASAIWAGDREIHPMANPTDAVRSSKGSVVSEIGGIANGARSSTAGNQMDAGFAGTSANSNIPQ